MCCFSQQKYYTISVGTKLKQPLTRDVENVDSVFPKGTRYGWKAFNVNPNSGSVSSQVYFSVWPSTGTLSLRSNQTVSKYTGVGIYGMEDLNGLSLLAYKNTVWAEVAFYGTVLDFKGRYSYDKGGVMASHAMIISFLVIDERTAKLVGGRYPDTQVFVPKRPLKKVSLAGGFVMPASMESYKRVL
jgi:hypothetical protein